VLSLVQSADAPTDRTSSTSVSVSRIRGTFWRVTRSRVSSAAAIIGRAAFLFPAGSREPVSERPPSTTYLIEDICRDCRRAKYGSALFVSSSHRLTSDFSKGYDPFPTSHRGPDRTSSTIRVGAV
jgi:hypothetical protein